MADSCITTISNILVAAAAISGVGIAWAGLGVWKKQLKGEAEYNLASRILRLCYQYRDAIADVRDPYFPDFEIAAYREEIEKLPLEKALHYGQVKAYQERWSRVNIVRSELYPEQLEAEVLWGDGLLNLIQPLFQMQANLFWAIRDEFEIKNAEFDSGGRNSTENLEDRNKRRALIFARQNNDEFRDEFNSKIKEISDFLKDHLKK